MEDCLRVGEKPNVEGESFTKNELEVKDLHLPQELNTGP